ncbi:hypothetical protein [Actinomadura kijaniata]|uniref:hypothetical protein n=1 Tax=Actinomadura kijaniata TaxID=46161 RepID=UPI0012FB50B5|nr:hypothetical protein [Actinomadura kijaniata]
MSVPSLRLVKKGERLHPEPDPVSGTHAQPSIRYATVVALDICSFGERDDCIQLHQRREMYAQAANAFEMTRIPWSACYREDRGDGVLIIAPPNVPSDYFLDPLAHHLTVLLRRYNRIVSAAARLRLRLAVHAGYVHHDAHGVAGRPLIHLFRLLESGEFKQAVAATDADLGLIVSDRLYADTCGYGGFIDGDAYRRLRVTCKETNTVARVWFPPNHDNGPSQAHDLPT